MLAVVTLPASAQTKNAKPSVAAESSVAARSAVAARPAFATKSSVDKFNNQLAINLGESPFPSGHVRFSGVASPADSANTWVIAYNLKSTIRYLNAAEELGQNWYVYFGIKMYKDPLANTDTDAHDYHYVTSYTDAYPTVADTCLGIHCLTFNVDRFFHVSPEIEKFKVTVRLMVRGSDGEFYSISDDVDSFTKPYPHP